MGSQHQDRFNNPDYGEQVIKSVAGVGTSSSTIHTVTAGYNLYLQQLNISRGGGLLRVYVADESAIVQYQLVGTNSGMSIDLRGSAPIPAGWMIRTITTSADAGNYVVMIGKEEVA